MGAITIRLGKVKPPNFTGENIFIDTLIIGGNPPSIVVGLVDL